MFEITNQFIVGETSCVQSLFFALGDLFENRRHSRHFSIQNPVACHHTSIQNGIILKIPEIPTESNHPK